MRVLPRMREGADYGCESSGAHISNSIPISSEFSNELSME